eukprot:9043711-Alexandrium_andersonii.AAC.1
MGVACEALGLDVGLTPNGLLSSEDDLDGRLAPVLVTRGTPGRPGGLPGALEEPGRRVPERRLRSAGACVHPRE